MDEVTKTQTEILALQEVKWPGKGQINKKYYLFYYSGTKEKTGQAGTGFLLVKKIQKHLINFELHNERLCKLRMKWEYNNITQINAYTPKEDKTGNKGTVL